MMKRSGILGAVACVAMAAALMVGGCGGGATTDTTTTTAGGNTTTTVGGSGSTSTTAGGGTTTTSSTTTTTTGSTPGSIEMVAVPGGSFEMGCGSWTTDCYSDESPVHTVTLSSFQIGKYEVTQGQWKAVMGSNPSFFPACGDNCPVESVSWNDVQNFITQLNTQTGGHYRLPTEAEWEYAARSGGLLEKYAGTSTNSLLGDYAWYSSNSGGTTHLVGVKLPNGLGIYDMSGNVWEWCSDWYGPYSSNAQNNPTGPAGGSLRVLRGGSWGGGPLYTRAANRDGGYPDNRRFNLGFRLARTP